MDPSFKFALWSGWLLVAVGLLSLAAIAVVFRHFDKKQDFGVEVDLGRAATVCVYTGLAILGILALGATVGAVLKGLKR